MTANGSIRAHKAAAAVPWSRTLQDVSHPQSA